MTSRFIPQHPPASPTVPPSFDAPVTHGRYAPRLPGDGNQRPPGRIYHAWAWIRSWFWWILP